MPSLEPVTGELRIKSNTGDADKATSAIKGFGESLQRAGEIALGINFARIGEEIGNITREVVKFAVDSASEFEQVKTQFDVLLGSVEAGSKMMSDIAQYEPNTSFNFEQLTGATQQLLAFGIAQDRIMPDLKVLGDISLGNAAKLNELGFALGEVNTQQKLTAHEARIFTLGAHIPIYQMLADYVNKTGGTMAQLNGTMAAGTAVHTAHASAASKTALATERLTDSTALANEKIAFLSTSHTKAEKAAFTHQQTLERLHNTVQLNTEKMGQFGKTTVTTGAAMVSSSKVTAKEIKEMVTSGAFSFQDVEKALAMSTEKGGMYFEAMKHHMNTFQGIVSSTQTQLQQLALDAMGFDMKAINDDGTENKHFGELNQGSAFDEMKKGLQSFLDYLKTHREEVANFFKSFLQAVITVSKAIIDLSMWVNKHREALAILAGVVAGVLVIALVAFAGWVVALIAGIGGLIGVGAAFMVTATGIAALVVGSLVAAFIILKMHIKETQQFFWDMANGVSNAVGWVIGKITDMVNTVIRGLNTMIDALNGIASKIPGMKIQFGHIAELGGGGGGSSSNPQVRAGSALSLQNAYGASSINITNNVTNNTPFDLNTFNRNVGLQVSGAK